MGKLRPQDFADLDREYAAKGWPTINPFRRDYCYQPVETGVHVCDQHPDGDNAMTAANIATSSAESAGELFERAKAELAATADEPHDLIVDLMIGGDIAEDFAMTRQMLVRFQDLSTALHPSETAQRREGDRG